MIEYTERYFRGLDLWSLGVDEAFINATVYGSQNYYLYSLSDECERVSEFDKTSDHLARFTINSFLFSILVPLQPSA